MGAVGGYILFGEQVSDWSFVGSALLSQLRVLWGTYEFDDFHEIFPITGFIWYKTFLIFVVILIQSLLLAEMAASYRRVRAKVSEPGTGIARQFRSWAMELRHGG